MSTERAMMLLQHVKTELLSKRVAEICTASPIKIRFKGYHVHQTAHRNEILKHVHIVNRSFDAPRLALANNVCPTNHGNLQDYMLFIKSPSPGQSRKKPDTRQRQEAGRTDKIPPGQNPEDEWKIERFARETEEKEAATGQKLRMSRWVISVWGSRFFGDRPFKMKPYVPPTSKMKAGEPAGLHSRLQVHVTRIHAYQLQSLAASFERQMRLIEEKEKSTGKESKYLRRSLARLSKKRENLPFQMRPYGSPTSAGNGAGPKLRTAKTSGTREEDDQSLSTPHPNFSPDYFLSFFILWMLLSLLGQKDPLKDKFYEMLGRARPVASVYTLMMDILSHDVPLANIIWFRDLVRIYSVADQEVERTAPAGKK